MYTHSVMFVAMEWNDPIGKKQSVWVIYYGFRTKDPWWWTRRYVGPEDTLSETHSAHWGTRPVYTRILAVGPILASDKTSSIWCAYKNKGSNESRYSAPITPHDHMSRDNEDRSRCYADLYRGSRCLVAAEGVKNPRVYAQTWVQLSVSKRRHAGDDRKTT